MIEAIGRCTHAVIVGQIIVHPQTSSLLQIIIIVEEEERKRKASLVFLSVLFFFFHILLHIIRRIANVFWLTKLPRRLGDLLDQTVRIFVLDDCIQQSETVLFLFVYLLLVLFVDIILQFAFLSLLFFSAVRMLCCSTLQSWIGICPSITSLFFFLFFYYYSSYDSRL